MGEFNYCPYCGKGVVHGATFCFNCGGRVDIKYDGRPRTIRNGLICPSCKNQTLIAIKHESYSVAPKTKTVIRPNLNPLRPFTLLEGYEKTIRSGYTVTGTVYECKSCKFQTLNPNSNSRAYDIENKVGNAFLKMCWTVIAIMTCLVIMLVVSR